MCAFCDFSSSNSGIACSEHTITVIVTIATIEINVYAFFFVCCAIQAHSSAIRCSIPNTITHRQKARDWRIRESDHRTFASWFACTILVYFLFLFLPLFLSLNLSIPLSLTLYIFVYKTAFFYLFIFFFCALIQFFHPHINLCIFCCWSVEFCSWCYMYKSRCATLYYILLLIPRYFFFVSLSFYSIHVLLSSTYLDPFTKQILFCPLRIYFFAHLYFNSLYFCHFLFIPICVFFCRVHTHFICMKCIYPFNYIFVFIYMRFFAFVGSFVGLPSLNFYFNSANFFFSFRFTHAN